jgi:hypothetical protein
VDARHARRREDWAGDFVRQTRCVTFTASGRKCAVSAGGQVLGNVHSLDSLKKAWEKWESLPETERAPGSVKVGADDARPPDAAIEPPEGTLVVRTYTRQLERDKTDGSLRYTEPEDYPVDEPAKMRSGSPRRQAARFREAGHDFMWVPENEWRALIPDDPKAGARGAVPESFKLRVLRYHLDPERGLGEAQWFTRAKAEDGVLEWVVEAASPTAIRLRIEGSAELKREGGDRPPTTYHPALLGYLSYDPRDKEVTEFKMIALGDVLNTPRGVRSGLHPLGIAFELTRKPKPAERVVPRGGRDNAERYLSMSR